MAPLQHDLLAHYLTSLLKACKKAIKTGKDETAVENYFQDRKYME